MNYDFKFGPEVAHGALAAAILYLLQAGTSFDPAAALGDPHTWLIALVGGFVRASAGGALAMMELGKNKA